MKLQLEGRVMLVLLVVMARRLLEGKPQCQKSGRGRKKKEEDDEAALRLHTEKVAEKGMEKEKRRRSKRRERT